MTYRVDPPPPLSSEAFVEVDIASTTKLGEAVPWVSAVVDATAEAGFECGLRVYESGEYEWWPTDGTDPHGRHYPVFHRAIVLMEPLRPAWVKLSDAALKALSEA